MMMSGENESKTQTTEQESELRKEVGKKKASTMEQAGEDFLTEEPKKSPLDIKRERVTRLLDLYPAKVGLGVLQPINEVNRYLTMSGAERRKMDAEDCGEAAVTLNQAGTYIQLELNKIRADINWCNKYIDWLVSNTITQYGTKWTPFEYRRLLASKDNDVALKLHTIISDAELQAQSLEYLPNQLRATAASYSELQQTKRRQRA